MRGQKLIDIIEIRECFDFSVHFSILENKEKILELLCEDSEGFEYTIDGKIVDHKEICNQLVDEMEKYCIQHNKPFGRGPRYRTKNVQ